MKQIYPISIALALMATPALAQTSTQTDTPPSTTPPAAGAPSSTGSGSTDKDMPSSKSPSPSAAPSVSPPARTTTDLDSAKKPMLTNEEAKAWVDKVVYSSDEKNVGEVVALQRDAAGHVTELHADIGGFLGLGETRVRVSPDQFKMAGDRIVLNLTAEQAKTLPKIAK